MMAFAVSCIVVGFLLRWMAMRELGRDFSLSLRIPSRVVKTGIYRVMRHPSYFGSLLIILGLAILLPLLGVMATAIAFFASRIVAEEDILRRNPDYRRYARRTGVFFPKKRREVEHTNLGE